MSPQSSVLAGNDASVDPDWASKSETGAIPDVLRGLEAVAAAVIDADGSLKDANRGFLLLMTRSMGSPRPSDVREMFVSPRFEEIVSRRPDFERTLYRGLLSFGRPGGRLTSLRSVLYATGDGIMLVGEHDIIGAEVLRSTMLELQDDLEEKQREIVHLEHRIARVQELADAALRDRDALLDALARHGVHSPK